MCAGVKLVAGPVELRIILHPKDKRLLDLDNSLKVLIDSLRGIAYTDGSVADDQEQFVLVDDIEVVDSSQRVIPSAIRFQRPNYIDDIRGGAMYMSVLNHAFKIIGCTTKGKLHAVRIPVVEHDQVGGQVVQRCAKVMNGVSQDSGEPIRQPLFDAKHDAVISGIRFTLYDSAIGVAVKELRDYEIEVRDVAIGPFGLKART